MTSASQVSVAVCVGSYLSISETFIYDQLIQAKRTRPWVLARSWAKARGQFPFEDVSVLGSPHWLAYYYAGLAPRVRRLLSERRPQLVHAHFGPNGTMVLPFAQALGIPLVVSFHGHDVGGLEPQNRWTARYHRYQRMAPRLFDYASLLLCASSELKQLLEARGAPRRKLIVHHLGVDTQVFRPPPTRERQPVVLMVGRLVEKKGMEYGIRAFGTVSQQHTSARLHIVGDGPMSSELRALVGTLGLGDRVRFLGALPTSGVLEEMARSSLLLTPSVTTASGDRESGVIVIKEAGAMGLPTVASEHGGIGEIIEHGTNGLLAPERDVEALSRHLTLLLSDQHLQRQMGMAARRMIEDRYDTRVQNARLEDLLIGAALGQ